MKKNLLATLAFVMFAGPFSIVSAQHSGLEALLPKIKLPGFEDPEYSTQELPGISMAVVDYYSDEDDEKSITLTITDIKQQTAQMVQHCAYIEEGGNIIQDGNTVKAFKYKGHFAVEMDMLELSNTFSVTVCVKNRYMVAVSVLGFPGKKEAYQLLDAVSWGSL